MPLYGVRDVSPLLADAAEMESLGTEPAEIAGAEVLQVMFEIESGPMLDLLPPSLHPTIPPTVTFTVWRCPDGPAGPFSLAQVRAGCRAGVRPRGFLLASYCDAEPAAEALRARWGYNCRPGLVRLRHYYDRIVGSVVVADRTILQVSLMDPQAISGGDVQYVANMNLARVRLDGVPTPRLVQVDPEFTFQKAERGRPMVDSFEPDAWRAEGLKPVYPVSASYTVAEIHLPTIRYIVDPEVPALQGTTTVNA